MISAKTAKQIMNAVFLIFKFKFLIHWFLKGVIKTISYVVKALFWVKADLPPKGKHAFLSTFCTQVNNK